VKTNEPINIFIVEDNKVFAMALKADIKTAFGNLPLNIHDFETGEACMEKFKEVKPWVVIMDYHLNSKHPNAADGIEVLDMIKKENKNTNVIMLTSEDNIDIALKSFKHGASDYIVKSNTTYRKINFSLFNLLKIMDAKKEALKYKYFMGLFIGLMGLMIGSVIAIQIFAPSIFN